MSTSPSESSSSATNAGIIATRLSKKTNRLKRDGYDPYYALHLAKEAVKFEWILTKGCDREEAAHLIANGIPLKQLMRAWTAIEPQWEGFQQRLQWLLKLAYSTVEAASMAVNNFDILIVMHDEECNRLGKPFRIEDFLSDSVEEEAAIPKINAQASRSNEEYNAVEGSSKQESSLCMKRSKPKSLPFYQTCHRTAPGPWRPPRVAVVKPITNWEASSSSATPATNMNTVPVEHFNPPMAPYYPPNEVATTVVPNYNWMAAGHSQNAWHSNIPASNPPGTSLQSKEDSANQPQDENEDFIQNWNKAWGD